MYHQLAFCLGCILLLSSCATQQPSTLTIIKKYPPLQENENVLVFEIADEIPPTCEKLGTVNIIGSANKCEWFDILNEAKSEARKTGGNAIKITKHIKPSILGNQCHKMIATILRIGGYSNSADVMDTMTTRNSTFVLSGEKPPPPLFRIAATGGWSYRTAELPSNIRDEQREYLNGLLSGYHFGGEITYFLFDDGEEYGLGLKYCEDRYMNSENIVVNTNNGTIPGLISDNIIFRFIGPIFTGRQISSNRRNALIANAGIGYVGYSNDAVFINKITMHGGTVGYILDIGYDIGITDETSIGLQASYMTAVITQMTINDGVSQTTVSAPPNSGESLSKVSFSIGIRWNK